ncbi:MAG: hypothetical protein R3B91_11115 [Planctomycetaceae bacterium]
MSAASRRSSPAKRDIDIASIGDVHEVDVDAEVASVNSVISILTLIAASKMTTTKPMSRMPDVTPSEIGDACTDDEYPITQGETRELKPNANRCIGVNESATSGYSRQHPGLPQERQSQCEMESVH